jgi:hypothetical protein
VKTQSDLYKKIPIVLRDIRHRETADMSEPDKNQQRALHPSVFGEVFSDPQSAPGNAGYGAGVGMTPDIKPYDLGMVPGGRP